MSLLLLSNKSFKNPLHLTKFNFYVKTGNNWKHQRVTTEMTFLIGSNPEEVSLHVAFGKLLLLLRLRINNFLQYTSSNTYLKVVPKRKVVSEFLGRLLFTLWLQIDHTVGKKLHGWKIAEAFGKFSRVDSPLC